MEFGIAGFLQLAAAILTLKPMPIFGDHFIAEVGKKSNARKGDEFSQDVPVNARNVL